MRATRIRGQRQGKARRAVEQAEKHRLGRRAEALGFGGSEQGIMARSAVFFSATMSPPIR